MQPFPIHSPMLNRREWLQIGASSLIGAGLASWGAASSRANSGDKARSAKSVIIVFLTGAPSHIDMFDPKPEAPPEIRGEFGTIATRVAGIPICEHLPLTAQLSDKYTLVRSLSHRENNHLVATHHLLTGHQQPGAFFDKIASRDDWPAYSAAVNYARPRTDGLPSGVNLPTFLMEGPLIWPGQHGGFLGPRHDPWQVTRNPDAKDFRVDNLRLSEGLAVEQLRDRVALLDSVNRQQRWLAESAEGKRLTDQQQRAVEVLTSGKISRAFEMEREPVQIRERYGRHAFGQSLLLARRLVQAGVPVVQANMGRVQNWDTHGEAFGRLKKSLLPTLDRAYSALIEDLSACGMLDDTMVVMLGEFGRTPKITPAAGTPAAGRDHWAPCFFGVFAGAGVRGGQVIGKSDKTGAYPVTNPFSPDDVGATILHALGLNPAMEVRDRFNRPVTLNSGSVMTGLYDGRG